MKTRLKALSVGVLILCAGCGSGFYSLEEYTVTDTNDEPHENAYFSIAVPKAASRIAKGKDSQDLPDVIPPILTFMETEKGQYAFQPFICLGEPHYGGGFSCRQQKTIKNRVVEEELRIGAAGTQICLDVLKTLGKEGRVLAPSERCYSIKHWCENPDSGKFDRECPQVWLANSQGADAGALEPLGAPSPGSGVGGRHRY